jgi:hypothetical protein
MAILSLPSAEDSATNLLVVTVKRMCRRPKVHLNLQYPPEMGEENVQRASLLSPEGQQEGQIFAKQPQWQMAVRVSPIQWDR